MNENLANTLSSEEKVPIEDALIGCCGLYCGLCPRYQSKAPSRCLSCHLGEQHDYCSVYRCCVQKQGLHTCAECETYPCERLLRVLGVEQGLDSFVSHKPALPNLERIRAAGLETFLVEARHRRLLAEYLIEHYNEGRSMTLYCTACALMPVELVQRAIDEAALHLRGDEPDIKTKAKVMKAELKSLAAQAGIDIKLQRTPK